MRYPANSDSNRVKVRGTQVALKTLPTQSPLWSRCAPRTSPAARIKLKAASERMMGASINQVNPCSKNHRGHGPKYHHHEPAIVKVEA